MVGQYLPQTNEKCYSILQCPMWFFLPTFRGSKHTPEKLDVDVAVPPTGNFSNTIGKRLFGCSCLLGTVICDQKRSFFTGKCWRDRKHLLPSCRDWKIIYFRSWLLVCICGMWKTSICHQKIIDCNRKRSFLSCISRLQRQYFSFVYAGTIHS
jgi:hypothetical protein